MWRAGATLCCSVRASHCGGFSCCGPRALVVQASVVAAHGLSSCGTRALRHAGFSCCGTWAQQLWLAGSRALTQWLWRTALVAPWHVGQGIEPLSPALAGGFLTTAPPGKSQELYFQFIIPIFLFNTYSKQQYPLSKR